MIRKALLLITIISLLLPAKAFPSDYGKYLPKWIELLKQGNDRERKLALHSLWFLEYPEFRKDISVFDPILNVLKDKDPSLREAAAASLGSIGELSKGCCKETKIIPSLIEALEDSDSKVRQEAANALGYYKDKRAIGPLIKKINDKDPWVRLNVVFSLGELNAKEAIAPLIDLLDDDTDWRDKFVQQECLIALRKMGGYIVIGDKRRLISVLMKRFDDEYLKAEIIKTLGLFQAEEASNLIIIATKDSNERIRRLSIDALSRFTRSGPPINQIDVYTNALKDTSVVVRVEAVEALRRSSSSRNREMIVDLLIGALSDGSKEVRVKAIEALSSFTDIRILDALINHFSEYQGYYENPAAESFLSISEKTRRERVYTYRKDGIRYVSRSNKEIPKEAGYYFEHIVHPAAVDRLISALNSIDPNTKLVALQIIWKFEDSRVEEHLIKLLDDPSPLVRQQAISALFSIAGDKSVPKLLEALKDSDSGVRTEAVKVLNALKINAVKSLIEVLRTKTENKDVRIGSAVTLGNIRDLSAVEPLIDLLRDNKEDVELRVAAVTALGKIGDERAIKPLQDLLKERSDDLTKAANDALKILDSVRKKEQEIEKVYYSALKLFKEKKYEEALPMFYKTLDQFAKFYASYPQQFKSYSNKITSIRIILAGYYRWKLKDINKAIEQYDELMATLNKFGSDSKAHMPYFFALAEIYENDVNDYEKAVMYYKEVLKPFAESKDIKPDEQYLAEWFLTWVNFRIERIKVIRLKQQPAFTKRTIKYPNLAYSALSFLGAYLGGPPESFVDEDIFNPGNEPQGAEVFDRFYERYPGSFRTLFMGLALFHQLSIDKPDRAIAMAEKIISSYPDDLNTVMLCLEVADLYKSRQNIKKYNEYLEKGRKTAMALNVELVMGPDPRFASPEDTWRLHVESLKKGDIDTAVECFSPHSGEKYDEMFTAMKDKLPEIASTMRSIQLIERDTESAKYRIRRMENGREITYYIYFVNIFGEWKIEQY